MASATREIRLEIKLLSYPAGLIRPSRIGGDDRYSPEGFYPLGSSGKPFPRNRVLKASAGEILVEELPADAWRRIAKDAEANRID